MSSHLHVTLAAEAHVDEILPHFRAYQQSYAEFAGAGERQTREFLVALVRDQQTGSLLIARDDERMVGFATAFVTVSGLLAAKMFHLGDLYVIPEYRGRQVGGLLIGAVRQEAVRRGIALVRWLSSAANPRLNAWYERLGATCHDFRLFILEAAEGKGHRA